MQHWPEGWMAKAYGLTWLVLLGALPMISMAVLYTRVIYSLWIKREEQSNASQKVQTICNTYIIFVENI